MSPTDVEGARPARHSTQVAILVPVYGNAATVAELAGQIADTLAQNYPDYLIVFVVDASPDDSWHVIRQLAQRDTRICGILLKRNQGQHRALMAGLRQVHAKWVVVMDADLQDPPALLPALLDECARQGATVFASRCGRYQSIGRMMTSRLFKFFLRQWIGLPVNVGSYFVVPESVVAKMRCAGIKQVQLVVMAWLFSPACSAVPYARSTRDKGTSAYSSWARMSAALRSVACVRQCHQWIKNTSMAEYRDDTTDLIADRLNI